jgi:ABC-type branched-subunit amino acid transport system permease subunit
LKDAQMVIYGVTLILCMRFLPDGLVSLPQRLKHLMHRGKE